jgi:thymidylate kinase
MRAGRRACARGTATCAARGSCGRQCDADMAAIALIGPDGAGKTTLTRRLAGSRLVPFKYLYMGVDIPASNIALPTSRLIERLKPRDVSNRRGQPPRRAPADRSRTTRALRAMWSSARLVNRLAEEWFRQLVSWQYQLRGWTVLYDRHFVFDFAPEITAGETPAFDRRLHRWALLNLYPQPDLVIFLDAPGEVLFARKGESTVEELERRRQAFLEVGRRLTNFVRVDATRPLDEVYAEVANHVVRFREAARPAVSVPGVGR